MQCLLSEPAHGNHVIPFEHPRNFLTWTLAQWNLFKRLQPIDHIPFDFSIFQCKDEDGQVKDGTIALKSITKYVTMQTRLLEHQLVYQIRSLWLLMSDLTVEYNLYCSCTYSLLQWTKYSALKAAILTCTTCWEGNNCFADERRDTIPSLSNLNGKS